MNGIQPYLLTFEYNHLVFVSYSVVMPPVASADRDVHLRVIAGEIIVTRSTLFVITIGVPPVPILLLGLRKSVVQVLSPHDFVREILNLREKRWLA